MELRVNTEGFILKCKEGKNKNTCILVSVLYINKIIYKMFILNNMKYYSGSTYSYSIF